MRRLLTVLLLLLASGLAAQRTPLRGDLLLSELLFDPIGDGADFVEVYNAAQDSVSLDGLQLINARGTTRKLTVDYVLPPGGYVVLTDDPQDIALQFPTADTSRMYFLDLPSLPNESGRVELLNPMGELLDAFAYDADMHSGLIDPEGVSLERRSFTVGSTAEGNWFSASSASGYGTPTQPNSQLVVTVGSEVVVELTATVFYPTATGQPQQAEVTYRTDVPGYLAELAVFDASGRAIASRPRTELLGTEGILHWDGRDTNGTLQPAGPYILLVSVFHPDGRTATYRLVAVLSR